MTVARVRPSLLAAVAAAAFGAGCLAGAADAQTPADPSTVSASGTGMAAVEPRDRRSHACTCAARRA